jgi:hypothetical protein
MRLELALTRALLLIAPWGHEAQRLMGTDQGTTLTALLVGAVDL